MEKIGAELICLVALFVVGSLARWLSCRYAFVCKYNDPEGKKFFAFVKMIMIIFAWVALSGLLIKICFGDDPISEPLVITIFLVMFSSYSLAHRANFIMNVKGK